MLEKHYKGFVKTHYKVCIVFVIILFVVCGTLYILENRVENSEVTALAEGTPETENPLKITVSDFRTNKEELQRITPALTLWDAPYFTDEDIVTSLNDLIEISLKGEGPPNGSFKNSEEVLVYANALMEKWGDPQKTSELRQRTHKRLQEVEALLATRKKRKLLRDNFIKAAEELIVDIKLRENEQRYQGVIDTEHQFPSQEP